MFKIQLIYAWRNLKKNKLVSVINIAGLTIGLACAILAILFAYHELTYESCHEKADRISRVYTLGRFGSMEKIPVTFCPVGIALPANYPEVELSARSRSINGIVFQDNVTPISEDEIVVADPAVFSIFTIPFESGSIPYNPGEIVLSGEMAEKYFRGNATGNNITISIYGQKRDFVVTGVFRDLPSTTHLKASFIIPFSMAEQLGWNTDEYYDTSYNVFTLTKKGTDIPGLNNKIAATYKIPVDIENVAIALVPIKRVHLYENISQNTKASLLILLVGGILALLISCFNYINLSSILFSTRSKEVGINKTIGAGKFDIFSQFMTHTLFTTLISFGLALLVISALIPSVNDLFDVTIESVLNFKSALLIIALFVLTCFLSGFYPALIQSGFKPVSLITNNANKQRKNRLMNVLITIQFVVSVMLLQFMIIGMKQANHMAKYDVTGLDGRNVLCINGNAWGDLNKVKDELLKNPGIEKVSWGSRVPRVGMGMIQEWKEEGNKEMALQFWMEGDYLEIFRINLLKGRTFTESFFDESRQEVVINTLTANSLGLDDPVGREMMIRGKPHLIIGMTDNFQAIPPIFKDMPVIILKSGPRNEHLLVRIDPSDLRETQTYIRETLSKINPDFPIEMQFYEDYMAELAKSYYSTGLIINVFTGIIIFNAMMGLFGLSYFLAERKNKEAGIRKVHGADAMHVLWMLGKGFVGKLVIAFCIATPLIYMGATGYLSIFPRHIDLGPGLFLTGGLLAMLILAVSSGVKLLQASNSNPVKTLRYE